VLSVALPEQRMGDGTTLPQGTQLFLHCGYSKAPPSPRSARAGAGALTEGPLEDSEWALPTCQARD
jgi:hypothetical protein